MEHVQDTISQIRRPKLLMATAREVSLRRHYVENKSKPKSVIEVTNTITRELESEDKRVSKSLDYNAKEHIELLADLIDYVGNNYGNT